MHDSLHATDTPELDGREGRRVRVRGGPGCSGETARVAVIATSCGWARSSMTSTGDFRALTAVLPGAGRLPAGRRAFAVGAVAILCVIDPERPADAPSNTIADSPPPPRATLPPLDNAVG